MSLISRMRKQTAVYWPLLSTEDGGYAFDVYGKFQLSDPIEVDVRWVDVVVEFLDKDGKPQISRSVVYVDRDMQIGEVLYLGTLDSLESETDPFSNDGAYEIRMFGKTPNLKNTEYLRKVYF